MNSNKLLLDVTIIRPILIILLILMHSFTIYSGGWVLPHGIHSIEIYKWIQHISFSFMLQGFMFISGYLYYYQKNKKYKSISSIVKRKAQRLLIPMIIFGLCYYFMFYFHKETFTIYDLFIKVLSGTGHLWFLPALFWCFIILEVLERLKLKSTVILSISFFFYLLIFLQIPFGISSTMVYFIYFYLGYYVMKHRTKILSFIIRNIRWMLFCYLITMIINYFFKNLILHNEDLLTEGLIIKGLIIYLGHILKFIVAVFGIAFILAIVNRYLNKKSVKILPQWLIKTNALCMGIYIYHQFILQILYYHTTLPNIGSYWLPWVAFSITLIISFVLSKLTIKSKILKI